MNLMDLIHLKVFIFAIVVKAMESLSGIIIDGFNARLVAEAVL
jgi:hypothetical protein